MKHFPKFLFIALLLAITAPAQAQPYTLYVLGQVSPCDPAMEGTTVTARVIQYDNTEVTATATLTANCFYSLHLTLADSSGLVSVSAMCGNGTWAGDSAFFELPGSQDLVMNLTCGSVANNCQACINIVSPAPWSADFLNCSTGGGPVPYTYNWWLPDGSTSNAENESWTFSSPGIYGVCLTINDGVGCSAMTCDTLTVADDGTITLGAVVPDCLGIPNGPNMPGTPCMAGGATGVWDSSCTCVPTPTCTACITVAPTAPFAANFSSCSTGGTAPYTYVWDFSGPGGGAVTTPTVNHAFAGPGVYTVCLNITDALGAWCQTCETVTVDTDGTVHTGPPAPCHASFWPVQAYDSTATGGVVPIPNLVWVWNLSSGGSGTYQFLWEFGDGSSSTEAYPTHEYSGPGPWLLCLTLTDDQGCTDTYCDSVSVDDNGLLNQLQFIPNGPDQPMRSGGFTLNVRHGLATGIATPAPLEMERTWPNPVTDELNISFGSRGSAELELTVSDAMGRTVLRERQHANAGENLVRLNTTTLEPGLYLLRLGNSSGSLGHRFIKTR